MGTESDRDTTRTAVKTYVPAYQREEWDDHAEKLDMSRSEFVRSMVQAGRRGFEEYASSETDGHAPTEPREATAAEQGSGSQDLEELVLETLSAEEHLSWEQLLAAVTDDIESRLEETLQDLQAENAVRYSGRNGGYTLQQ